MDLNVKLISRANKISLYIALASIVGGVITAISLIFGIGITETILWRTFFSFIVLFIGASSSLCTLRYFYSNLGSDGSS